jgi:hypothetical protein
MRASMPASRSRGMAARAALRPAVSPSKQSTTDSAKRAMRATWGGEGGAEGGDGLAVAALVHGDDVDVALDEDGSAGAAHVLAGEVEAEQGLALGVEQGLGGVHVLGGLAAVLVLGVLGEDAAGEGDDGATGLYDGEHQSAAELVIKVVGALGAGDEAELLGEGEGEAFALEVAGEAVPAGLGGCGGVAELEGLGGLGGDAAFFLIEAAELALFAGEEDLAVELGGGAGDGVGLVALGLLGEAGGVLEAGGELDAVRWASWRAASMKLLPSMRISKSSPSPHTPQPKHLKLRRSGLT